MPSGASTSTGWLKPERQLERVVALGAGAIADADDLEVLAEALAHADDHVVDQRAGQPVQGTALALVVGPLDERATPSSLRTVMPLGELVRSRVPLGPLTVTDRAAMETSTPEGTGMGALPMRDMAAPTRRSRGPRRRRGACEPRGR